jgi:hypothetical protein
MRAPPRAGCRPGPTSCFLISLLAGTLELGNLETATDMVSLFCGRQEVLSPLAGVFAKGIAGGPIV